MKKSLLLFVGAVTVAIGLIGLVAVYFAGYRHGRKDSTAHLNNGEYKFTFYNPGKKPERIEFNEWETNDVKNIERWTTYTYGQGVTNGVLAAVSSLTDLMVRTASGEKPTPVSVTHAIFGSISNAMSQDKYRYFDSRAFNESR